MAIIIGLQFALVAWLVRYFLRRDKGPQEPKGALLYAGMLGVFGVLVASVLEAYIIPAGAIPTANQHDLHISLPGLVMACIAVGVIEEGAKALPLKRFLYDKLYFNEVSDGIIYFGIAGMLFGALENIGYALTYGSGVGLARIITIPFMHAGFTSIVGYAIARQKMLKLPAHSWWRGFLLAITLHAVYDFGLIYGSTASRIVSLALTVVVNLAVFYLYKKARRLDPVIPLPPAQP